MENTLYTISLPTQALKFRDTLLWFMQATPVTILNPIVNCWDQVTEAQRASFLYLLRMASVVLWKDDMHKAAVNGAELFVGKTIDPALLKFEPQLWVYESDWGLKCGPLIPDNYNMTATLVVKSHGLYNQEPAFIEILMPWLGEPDVKTLDLTQNGLRLLFWQSGVKDKADNHCCKLAALEFMNLELVELEQMPVSRQVRRNAQRSGKPVPDCRTIVLRRRKLPSHDPASETEWSCRWLVEGHWRNQWFPSRKDHHPVYIVPYVKGPEDKPFRENRAEKVFVVAR